MERTSGADRYLFTSIIDLKKSSSGKPGDVSGLDEVVRMATADNQEIKGVDLTKAAVEVRQLTVQQVHVNGKPVGSAVPISR